MKKIILLLVMAMFAAPAMAAVTIEVNDLGGGWLALDYNSTDDVNIVSFGLDISVSAGNIIDVNILHVGENDANGLGFGIFPASFDRFIDPNDPNWGNAGYTPVADAGDPGAAGGLPGPAITIELGALGHPAPKSGRLIEIKVDAPCTMCVSNNSSRGGVVLEGGGSGGFVGACGPPEPPLPPCWSCPTQCYGDTNCDAPVTINTTDFLAFKWAYLTDYWGGGLTDGKPGYAYDPCADFSRDGYVGTTDFLAFKYHYLKVPPPDCTPGIPPGETWPPTP
ncbi:MAG: hypothetical protein ACYSYU_10870 [Planctomycetota bacterium]|jgi:hypothetical protein